MVRTLVLVGVTALVLIGLATGRVTTDVYTLIGSLGASRLLAVLLLTLVLPITHAWRLQVALLATDRRLGFGRSLRLTLAVWPISSLTPAKSGDLVKAYYLRDSVPADGHGRRLAGRAGRGPGGLGQPVARRVAVLSAARRVGVFGVGARRRADAVHGGAVGRPFAALGWPARKAGSAASDDAAVARRPMLLALLVGLTLANCVVTILVTAILFDGVGASVPLAYVTAAVLPAMFAGLLPFTLAGMGTRDSVMIVLFAGYASSAQALTVGLVYAFFFRWLLSLLGLPFLQQLMRTAATAERR